MLENKAIFACTQKSQLPREQCENYTILGLFLLTLLSFPKFIKIRSSFPIHSFKQIYNLKKQNHFKIPHKIVLEMISTLTDIL